MMLQQLQNVVNMRNPKYAIICFTVIPLTINDTPNAPMKLLMSSHPQCKSFSKYTPQMLFTFLPSVMVCNPVVHINFHKVGLVCMTFTNDNGCM